MRRIAFATFICLSLNGVVNAAPACSRAPVSVLTKAPRYSWGYFGAKSRPNAVTTRTNYSGTANYWSFGW